MIAALESLAKKNATLAISTGWSSSGMHCSFLSIRLTAGVTNFLQLSLGHDPPRGQCIDPNVSGTEFAGEAASEADDAGLGGNVSTHFGRREVMRDG